MAFRPKRPGGAKFPLRVGIFALLLTAAATAVSGSVCAQTDDMERATARASAQKGILAVMEGRYSEGVELLERAESMVHAPTHLLYLARAYDKLGKLVRSRETYLKLTKEELKPSAPKAFRDARAAGRTELAQLEPRIPSITIQVEAANLNDVIVSEDEVPLPPGLLGIARPADPGRHTYVASADGFEPASKTVVLAEGASETIVLVPRRSSAALTQDAASSGVSASASATGPEGEPSAGVGLRTWGYVALGVSAAGIGAGTYLLVRAMGHQSNADDLFAACKPRGCSTEEKERVLDQDDSAYKERWGAGIGFAAGGVAMAAGLTILLVLPREEKETVAVRPWVSPNGAGLLGTF